jgi:Na+/melibiose symporter-like transporter
VVIALVILVLSRRIQDAASTEQHRLDFVGSILSALGLGLAVFGVLRSSVWGWITPKEGAPSIFGLSLVAWLILAGLLILWGLFAWEGRQEREGKEPLVRPSMFRNRQLDSGLTMFLFQFFIQAGIFFTIPLYLSIVLELSALQTGIRLIPLSLALLASAIGVPRLWPKASPRRVVRIGLVLLLVATVLLIALLDADATASVVTVPLLIMGLGSGALASQLGAVTVSAVPDKDSSEVGGLQNTALNLGASLGTALVGSVLIMILTTLVLQGVLASPSIPDSLKADAQTTFGAGVPFVSDTAVRTSLEAYGASEATIQEVLQINADARLAALRGAMFVVVIAAALALFFTRRIPTEPPGASIVVSEDAGVKDLQEQAE